MSSRAISLRLLAVALCACVFATSISLQTPLLALLLEARGESATIIGLLGAVTGAGIIITPFFAPALVGKIGAPAALQGALGVSVVVVLLFKVFEDSLAAWFVLRFGVALAASLLFVGSEAWMMAIAPAARRGMIFAVYGAAVAAGLAAGPLILAATGIHGWPPFIAAALLCAPAFLALRYAAAEGGAPHFPAARRGFWRLFAAFPMPFVCVAAVGAGEVAVHDLLPPYASRLNWTAQNAVLLLAAFSVGGIALQIPISALSDWAGRRRVILVCGAVFAAGALLLPKAAAWGGAWPFLFMGLWGAFLPAAYPVAMAAAAGQLSAAQLLPANALFALSYGVGALLGPAVAGFAMENVIAPDGFAVALAVFGGMLGVSAVLKSRG